jgi:hypothetical protein
MARSVRRERQLLSAEEFALVGKTHHPCLESLSERDLAAVLKLLRERRDRTQRIAGRQRRELRGKSAPKGTRAATDDAGTRNKKDLLAAAVQRLNEEVTRRKVKTRHQSLVESAARALELRRASVAKTTRPFFSRTSNPGKQAKTPAPLRAPRNPAKMGAISQHTKNMQAKRDAK